MNPTPTLSHQVQLYDLIPPSAWDRARTLVAQPPQAVQEVRILSVEEVEWVVNDIAELGVKIGNQFFWLYKGRSLVYGTEPEKIARNVVLNEDTDPPKVMHWRPVFKREFGECCHPVNYADLRKCGHPHVIGTVSRDDSDEWKPVPAAISATTKQEN